MDDSVDNYGFLADHALPQYFTIIILLLLLFLYYIYIYLLKTESLDNAILAFWLA